ncbi:MAG TPA: peptidylprolyl isomerase [Rubrivivax sp.]|nr:peptidylprolyl isomerase [Rubrivivax sp.]
MLRLRSMALALGAAMMLALGQAQAENTIVRVHTSLGPIDMQLLDDEAPRTVANFLAYVNGGDYESVFFHRSVHNFVIQAGGFRWMAGSANCCQPVTSRGKVQNEFAATRSNLRGTVAMAKVGSDPDSATSQWFVNLADNSANLDKQNGGFTVFARVSEPSMAVVDRIAALTVVNAGSPYNELPVTGWKPLTPIERNNLVSIRRAEIVPPRAQLSDAERVFDYLEAAFPQYIDSSSSVRGEADGYSYRYYSGSNAYVGLKDDKLWYLVPAIDSNINLLGTLAEWLAIAQAAGY